MEDIKERLQRMKEEQHKLSKEFDAVVSTYENSDVHQHNETLQRENEAYQKALEELRTTYQDVKKENENLRHALQEQMLDEKTNILKLSRKKMHTYFGKAMDSTRDQLSRFEEDAKKNIEQLKHKRAQSIHQEAEAVDQRLQELTEEVEEAARKERNLLAEQERDLLYSMSQSYEDFAGGDIDEETIEKRKKENQIEMKIGLSWINKLGILLILLGVAAAFRYSYTTWFNDEIKGAAFAVLGLLMLAAGEWFFRKQKQTFAVGLTGGGIAVLYGSVFFSYFLLEIIGMTPALVSSVVITAGAIALSLYYQSKTVCTFGLVGGYLPFYSYMAAFGLDETAVYAAMVYFMLLNGSVLGLSFQKRWTIVHQISFWLNIPTFLILTALSPVKGVSFVFAIATFLLYLSLTAAYPFIYRTAIKYADVTLLSMNTLVSCAVMYFLLHVMQWEDGAGLLALSFAVLYFALGQLAAERMSGEKQTVVLFYGLALAFMVLAVPFQFDWEWAALGWLAEALVIMFYANQYSVRLLEKAGWVVLGLSFGMFAVEAARYVDGENPPLFHLEYTFMTAGLLLVMFYYIHAQKKTAHVVLFRGFHRFIDVVKYVALMNLWIYAVYESLHWYYEFVPVSFDHYWFYQWLILAFLSVGIGYGMKKTPLLYDKVVGYLCLFLYGTGGLAAFVVTAAIPAVGTDADRLVDYTALAVLIVCQAVIFTTGRDLLLAFMRARHMNAEWYPAASGLYFFIIQAAFLHVQLQLDGAGFVISLIYLITALGYITYGFMRGFVYIRRIGLALTLFATGKLFLADLAFLGEMSQIAAYFCFGIVLIGISYLYQKVSSRQKEQA
ncbi:DUF2339 domain-containing protein [Salibacterium halotolerans]|uniref:Predicted membrane protein n=1 Tax=Salibacterium halotolerans TaxID=1884432 RepID=A0A1I5SQ80_9BACI|nr:DUF2339 domain-containing protein [Salibacterium halotolerans]SFP72446.1 Predicted membrane protein [Salibacterium halotolerans]